jgi:hypothetical protein
MRRLLLQSYDPIDSARCVGQRIRVGPDSSYRTARRRFNRWALTSTVNIIVKSYRVISSMIRVALVVRVQLAKSFNQYFGTLAQQESVHEKGCKVGIWTAPSAGIFWWVGLSWRYEKQRDRTQARALWHS